MRYFRFGHETRKLFEWNGSSTKAMMLCMPHIRSFSLILPGALLRKKGFWRRLMQLWRGEWWMCMWPRYTKRSVPFHGMEMYTAVDVGDADKINLSFVEFAERVSPLARNTPFR